MKKICIIGCGAAGMMAAIVAARNGCSVEILEKNERPGKKLYITGKGRCNLTNACEEDKLFSNIVGNSKFLFSAFRRFNNRDTMAFFEHELYLPLVTERGERVFPKSQHSGDVIDCLTKEMKRLHVRIRYRTQAQEVITEQGHVTGVITTDKEKILCDACILATGGLSYPSTGSTGDGYRIAKQLGHTVISCKPSLVALLLKEKEECAQLEGLSLKNIALSLRIGGKEVYHDFGELVFTATGISGPVILSASSVLAHTSGTSQENAPITISLDLKPALSTEQLNIRVLRDFELSKNKLCKNCLDALLPQRLRNNILARSAISPEQAVNAVTKSERERLISTLKGYSFTVTGLAGYEEAVITVGGVCVKEINPKTMESKLVEGLYFAGEVMDVDAMTGGFNLQIAWSTAYCAGLAASERIS